MTSRETTADSLIRVSEDLRIRLKARTAATYLALGHHRTARIYAESGYGCVQNKADRDRYYEKVPLEIGSERNAFSDSYAELMVATARISAYNRDHREAVMMIEEACRLDLANQVRIREAYQKKVEKWAKRKQIHNLNINARVQSTYFEIANFCVHL